MEHIVLTSDQKIFLDDFLSKYKDQMIKAGLSIIPTPIKNDLWVLPTSVLEDERCLEAKKELIQGGNLEKMTIREVLHEESLVYNF